MAKKKQKNPKVVKIIIEELNLNPNVWHIKVETGQKLSEKKIEETICPKDIFGGAITNYTTLINVMRMIHQSIDPVRKNVEISLKKMKEEQTNPKPEEKPIKKLTQHDIDKARKEQKATLTQAKSQVTFLSGATEALKKNLSSDGMLEKVALALALTEVVTYEDIEKKIKIKKKYDIELPITKYSDLSVMQTQNTSQWFGVIENMLNIGGAFAKVTTGGL